MKNSKSFRITSIGAILLQIALIFSLVSAQVTEKLDHPIRFAVIGDRTGTAMPGIYEQIVTEIQRLRPDFVTNVGDMIEGPTTDSLEMVRKWREYNIIVSLFTMPYYRTPGNNEIESDFEERMYRQFVGEPYYSTDYQNIHLIIFDNARWTDSEDLLESEYGARQVAWLKNDLENSQGATYTFVFMHKPFWYNSTAEGKDDTLHTLFVKYGVDGVFCGHFHDYFTGEYDDVKYSTMGSSGSGASVSPTGLLYHFVWVTLDDDGVHISPIKINSVLPWDEITAEERKTFMPIKDHGLSFAVPLIINKNMVIENPRVALTLDNTYSQFPVNDTIEWSVPEGWVINPEKMPVDVNAGEQKAFYFNASCSGRIFPPPQAEVEFNYAADKKVKAEGILPVAQHAVCNKRDGEIKIDGEIKESFWRDPVSRLFNNDGSEMDVEPVRFYFAYDEDNLYLAAYCEDTRMDELKVRADEHDGTVYQDDCVGFFYEPSFESDTMYLTYISAAGVIYDASYWLTEQGYITGTEDWNGEYESAAVRGGDFWSVEIKVPLKQFGVKAVEGDRMRVNFRRKHQRLNAASVWQAPWNWDPGMWGYLNLE